MRRSKASIAVSAFLGSAVAAGSAWAHTSLMPHAHPHGHSLLMGDTALLIAMGAAAAVVGALALAVGRRRTGQVRVDRRRP